MKLSKTKTIVIPLLTFVFGVLLGPGALWQWSLGERSYRLETSKHITELRRDVNELFLSIVELFSEYAPTGSTYRGMQYQYGFGIKDVFLTDQHIREKYIEFQKIKKKHDDLKTKLDFLISDYNILENKLAKLEKRKARALPVDFGIPAPPQSFNATVVTKE